MITRRLTRRCIALLLPLMVLRALLPAGYMPAVEHGQWRMVMCSAGLQLPAAHHTDHQPIPDHPGSGHSGSPDGGCPFASAAQTAPVCQYVVAIIEPLRKVQFAAVAADDLPPATGPPRRTAARGPPSLS